MDINFETLDDSSYEALPSLLNQNLLIRISTLNLSVRTENCMRAAKVRYLGDLVKLTQIQVRKLPNLGKKSLDELNYVLKSFDLKLGMNIPNWSPEVAEELFKEGKSSNFISMPLEGEECTEYSEISKYINMGLLKKVERLGLSVRSSNCLQNNNIILIGDLVVQTENQLLSLPDLGRGSVNELKMALENENLHFGMKLRFWPIENADEVASQHEYKLAHQNEEILLNHFNNFLQKLDNSRTLKIMEARLGMNGKTKTLEEVAQDLKITRERVRQIQKKITMKILKNEFWSKVLQIRLNKILTNTIEPLFLDTLEQEDPWFSGFGDKPLLLENILLEYSHIENLNFIPHENRKLISRISYEHLQKIQRELIEMLDHSLDTEHTIDDVEMFVQYELAKKGAAELTPILLEALSKNLNFSIINGDLRLVSVGNSLASQLKVILEEASSPLHFEEITSLYEKKFGIPVSTRYVHACLVSSTSFHLLGRGSYGLPKHLLIPDDDQKYILDRVEDIILSGLPQRQWHTKDLIDKLEPSSNSDVLNAYSINCILKSSKKLSYLGKFSWKVRSNEAENEDRVHIQREIYRILKEVGHALHITELQNLVSKARGVGSFFLPISNKLYSRVNPSTWGLLERDFVLNLSEQADLKDFLFDILSNNGVALHKTELLGTIRNLTLPIDITDNIVLGILVSDNRFKPWHGGYVGLSDWKSSGRKTFAAAVKEVAENALESMTTDQIVNLLKAILGYEFNRYSISPYLNRYGMYYCQVENIWKKKTESLNVSLVLQ